MDSNELRLQVYLAKCGIGSRRKCEEYIAQGRVTVNGKTAIKPGIKVSSEDQVTFDGHNAKLREREIYIAFHKPSKFLCTSSDPDNRPLIFDLLPTGISKQVQYVGRLDYMTSGLLLLTSDGSFSREITLPGSHMEKEYVVTTKKEIPKELLEQFCRGLTIEGEHFKLKGYELKNAYTVHLILEEGKNRELRKVFQSRNITVKKVHRIRIGQVLLKGIQSGHYRNLTEKEIQGLLKSKKRKPSTGSKKVTGSVGGLIKDRRIRSLKKTSTKK